jgi:complex I assembly factor TIMMDC1
VLQIVNGSEYNLLLATGAMYKFNMGLKGMVSGGLVGTFIGGFAGVISLLVLNATGMTMEDMRYWQYKWREQRDDTLEHVKKRSIEGTEHDDGHYAAHDDKVGTGKLDLNALELDSNKYKILQAAAKENEAIMKAAEKEGQSASGSK